MADATNADELFLAMLGEIRRQRRSRRVVEDSSPQKDDTVEAAFCSFSLKNVTLNCTSIRAVNVKWALANALHFFTASEEAGSIRQYNELADRYLTDGMWIGAYGAVAVPQLRKCAELLNKDPGTRRACATILTTDAHDRHNANVPPCPLCLHFLSDGKQLSMAVYQRSLNLFGVMPYDCVLLTNVLRWACLQTGAQYGELHWFVGSLHCRRATSNVGSTNQTSFLDP